VARKQGTFLDSVWARLIAGLVAATVSGLLVWINRDALTGAAAPTGPLAECLAERLGHVDKLIVDGVVSSGQADEFRIRARQFCEQTVKPD
jgi:hypothetical protein